MQVEITKILNNGQIWRVLYENGLVFTAAWERLTRQSARRPVVWLLHAENNARTTQRQGSNVHPHCAQLALFSRRVRVCGNSSRSPQRHVIKRVYRYDSAQYTPVLAVSDGHREKGGNRKQVSFPATAGSRWQVHASLTFPWTLCTQSSLLFDF